LTATVKTLTHGLGAPTGSITFLDGTIILGKVTLRGGAAVLKSSNLRVGANAIRANYTPSQRFATSAASIVENVSAHRAKTKTRTSGRKMRGAVPMDAVTIVGSSTVLGPLDLNWASLKTLHAIVRQRRCPTVS
jgi:Bacterial Ig-like domain (group 3)